MILAVGNIKGGVGKTTLAVNLAIIRATAGQDVLLVDGDEQRTALTFTDLRTEQLGQPGYTAVSLQRAAFRTQVRQLAGKYDDIVIDVGGRDTGSPRAALTVLNAADAQGHDNEDAAEAIREMAGIELLDLLIGRRKAFPNAVAAGRAVTEHTPQRSQSHRRNLQSRQPSI